ncbi:uncharacterized protein RSE6_05789 [Rhynchosporium secalis]|uniref:Mucin n=1 Tax=Rhynchosporium secalis TaxID=38038 RepID=A0A1E1M9W4_RHYSE|nr:uncharacterized protein RSE6_05789 [Rhynchosporium secalis]
MLEHTFSSTLDAHHSASAASFSSSGLSTDLKVEADIECDTNHTETPLSPRILYAQSIGCPGSSRSLPHTQRFRKNMKEMTGFGTTEEEFDALPLVLRRKVRVVKPLSFCLNLLSLLQVCKKPICDQFESFSIFLRRTPKLAVGVAPGSRSITITSTYYFLQSRSDFCALFYVVVRTGIKDGSAAILAIDTPSAPPSIIAVLFQIEYTGAASSQSHTPTPTPFLPTRQPVSLSRPPFRWRPTTCSSRRRLLECTMLLVFLNVKFAGSGDYFSTLERLRFAQTPRTNALHELPIQSHRKSSIADRRGVNVTLIEPRRNPSRRQWHLARQHSVSDPEASWFLTLPDKIKNKHFSREEQVLLAGRLRGSVILDAADEAVFKANRRASRIVPVTPLFDESPPGTPQSSTGSHRSNIQQENTSNMTAQMYESFRWMDEEQDLDLKLALDDYHANLDGVVIPTPSSVMRPSFRRQMSVSKMPFGRNSLPPKSRSPLTPTSEPSINNGRNRSRTMSLIQPKNVAQPPTATIDPNAAHYQDPEARLKLRVYLASPQKFDEAIEFGFPSLDGVSDGVDKENKPPSHISKEVSGAKKLLGLEVDQSFLSDDMSSLFDDDVSMADPESPLTPRGDTGFRSQNNSIATSGSKDSKKSSSDYSHLGISKPMIVKQPEAYTHLMAGSREMTLRMTLTRPDLRADETTIYAWQRCKSPLSEGPSSSIDEKSDIRGPLGGIDGWGPDRETGVVKRFWNKVKSSQRRTA